MDVIGQALAPLFSVDTCRVLSAGEFALELVSFPAAQTGSPQLPKASGQYFEQLASARNRLQEIQESCC
jgi:hypothetical protein